jgi:hypothetical protein
VREERARVCVGRTAVGRRRRFSALAHLAGVARTVRGSCSTAHESNAVANARVLRFLKRNFTTSNHEPRRDLRTAFAPVKLRRPSGVPVAMLTHRVQRFEGCPFGIAIDNSPSVPLRQHKQVGTWSAHGAPLPTIRTVGRESWLPKRVSNGFQ